MTRYERCTLSVDNGVCDVEGRIVEVLDAPRAGRNTITALVEVPSEESTTPTTFSTDPEGVDETSKKGVFFCQGTNADDSACSREVSEPGDRCWQHPENDS